MNEKAVKKLMAEIDRRIAEYLRCNGFADLEEAADREWGDTRPLEVHPDHRTELEWGE